MARSSVTGQRIMVPCEDVELSKVVVNIKKVIAPRLAGWTLRLVVWLLELPVLGKLLLNKMAHENGIIEMFRKTVIPEEPTFLPDLADGDPPFEKATCSLVEQGSSAIDCIEAAMEGLPRTRRPFEEGREKQQDEAIAASPWRRWTIRDYHDAYVKGKTTPTEVANRLLDAVTSSRKCKPSMNFFIQIDPDDVLRQADESSRRFKSGSQLSVLDGVPVAVKDEIDCMPYETTGGTTWMGKLRSVKQDAPVVARLRECGVMFVGKTNMHEIGMGTSGLNTHFGTPRNPYEPNRFTGGSSSGSAAVVSAGLVPAALGTDAGGSIRIPSALCGVTGLKPSFGRVNNKGTIELCYSLCVMGPICATVEDTSIMYAVMASTDPKALRTNTTAISPECSGRTNVTATPNSSSKHLKGVERGMPVALPYFEGSGFNRSGITEALEGLRLGKYGQWFDTANHEVVEVCDRALDSLVRNYNARITDIVVPELHEMNKAHLVTIGSECASAINVDYEQGRTRKLSHEIRLNLEVFRSFTTCDYIHAQQIRTRGTYFFTQILQDVDVIVTPTTGITAPEIPPDLLPYGETNLQGTSKLMTFIIGPNLFGLPAISVPVGYDCHGLPIALQLIGRPWAEATLLRIAGALETLCAPLMKAPAVFYDILEGSS